MSRWRSALLVPALIVLATTRPAAADGPTLHEQIPPDPHEDLALNVTLDGDLPAALDTKSGVVPAPDPRKPVAPNEPAGDDKSSGTFSPDRNTRRPDVQGYDEPFTPSTAPFKRLEAFDTVTAGFELFVRDKRLQTLATNTAAGPDDEPFYADLVIDIAPGRKVRVPSVGPEAKVVRARLGIGAQDIPIHMWKDGAENWFAEGYGMSGKARLVMQLSIPRGVFGGEFADAPWGAMRKVPPLPENVSASAKEVAQALGVGPHLRPRDNVQKLVAYFRSFVDSEEPPRGRANIYLDLALSRKGVCRHRAFAFMVTALHLGIPTRMVINEAHAWVEVHDSVLWRRIDLGGAGRMVNPASNLVPERAVHQPPPDAFSWPQGSERGEDMVEQARQRARDPNAPSTAQGDAGAPPLSTPADGGGPGPQTPPSAPTSSTHGMTPAPNGAMSPGDSKDERPPAALTIAVTDANAHRGAPLHVRGEVKADGDPCANVMVEILLRDIKDPSKLRLLGTVATTEKGTYAGSIVIPGSIELGDYDLVARTSGDARCGRGWSP